jgi:hypothetical protein
MSVGEGELRDYDEDCLPKRGTDRDSEGRGYGLHDGRETWTQADIHATAIAWDWLDGENNSISRLTVRAKLAGTVSKAPSPVKTERLARSSSAHGWLRSLQSSKWLRTLALGGEYCCFFGLQGKGSSRLSADSVQRLPSLLQSRLDILLQFR